MRVVIITLNAAERDTDMQHRKNRERGILPWIGT